MEPQEIVTIIVVLAIIAFGVYQVWRNNGFSIIQEIINTVSSTATTMKQAAK